MKRSEAASTKGKSSREVKPARLLERAPEVYLGPRALSSLQEGSGILQGMQRPGRVDLLEFQPVLGGGYRRLIEARFREAGDWENVGIVLRMEELDRRRVALTLDLVPGDIVLACSEGGGKPATYVNAGDTLLPARLKVSRTKLVST